MKKETDSKGTLVYDNEFRWAYVWQFLLYAVSYILYSALLLLLSCYFICLITGLPFVSYIPPIGVFAGITTILLLIYNALQYLPRVSTGKYCIMGDNLIVNERYFSDKIDLTIPIAGITKVQRTSYVIGWSRFWKEKTTGYVVPFKFIEVTVGEQKYLLYCITHAEELCAELNKRIEKNKDNN